MVIDKSLEAEYGLAWELNTPGDPVLGMGFLKPSWVLIPGISPGSHCEDQIKILCSFGQEEGASKQFGISP